MFRKRIIDTIQLSYSTGLVLFFSVSYFTYAAIEKIIVLENKVLSLKEENERLLINIAELTEKNKTLLLKLQNMDFELYNRMATPEKIIKTPFNSTVSVIDYIPTFTAEHLYKIVYFIVVAALVGGTLFISWHFYTKGGEYLSQLVQECMKSFFRTSSKPAANINPVDNKPTIDFYIEAKDSGLLKDHQIWVHHDNITESTVIRLKNVVVDENNNWISLEEFLGLFSSKASQNSTMDLIKSYVDKGDPKITAVCDSSRSLIRFIDESRLTSDRVINIDLYGNRSFSEATYRGIVDDIETLNTTFSDINLLAIENTPTIANTTIPLIENAETITTVGASLGSLL